MGQHGLCLGKVYSELTSVSPTESSKFSNSSTTSPFSSLPITFTTTRFPRVGRLFSSPATSTWAVQTRSPAWPDGWMADRQILIHFSFLFFETAPFSKSAHCRGCRRTRVRGRTPWRRLGWFSSPLSRRFSPTLGCRSCSCFEKNRRSRSDFSTCRYREGERGRSRWEQQLRMATRRLPRAFLRLDSRQPEHLQVTLTLKNVSTYFFYEMWREVNIHLPINSRR